VIAAVLAFVIVLGVAGGPASPFPIPSPTPVPTATPNTLQLGDDRYSAGDFAGAYALYRKAADADPSSAEALTKAGRLALYANDLTACRSYLHAARALPGSATAQIDASLAEADHRSAVALDLSAAALPAAGVTIPMVARDPLPLFAAKVDGHDAYFMLDTGAPNLVLDPAFVQELGLTLSSGGTGHFAGGKTAQFQSTQVPQFQLGGASLSNQPAIVLPTRGLPFFGSKRVDGIIGTIFLSHFLATIDYPHSQLVLRSRSASKAFEDALGPTAVRVPFWFVGDHFLFAHGAVNALDNVLMLVDSGLAGGGFTPSKDTVTAAHIVLQTDKASKGIGGGGTVTAIPFVADRVCLGQTCQPNIAGLYTPEGSPLAMFPFAVAGFVSHGYLEHYAVTFDFDAMRIVLI